MDDCDVLLLTTTRDFRKTTTWTLGRTKEMPGAGDRVSERQELSNDFYEESAIRPAYVLL